MKNNIEIYYVMQDDGEWYDRQSDALTEIGSRNTLPH